MSTTLNHDERAALEAMADRLIPEDETGPGAVAMGAHIAALRSLDGELRARVPAVKAALAALGAGFAGASTKDQEAAIARLEAAEAGAFGLLRTLVLEGAFGDPAHGGNADGAGWALLGYPGPRHVVTAEDQAIRVIA